MTRWIASGKAGGVEVPEAEEGWTQEDQDMEYGTPPPVEEPQLYSLAMSESSLDLEGNCAVTMCRVTMKNVIVDHFRSVGGKLQLIEDLELSRIDAENIAKVLEGCRPYEMNALLLYASFLGRADLLPGFLEAGADLNHSEPQQGMSPLHLCAFSNSVDGVRFLIKNGANVNASKVYTPFQYAAFGNSFDVAQFFIADGVAQENPACDDSVLHAAARSNSQDVLKLVAPGNPLLNRLDGSGHAPIHYVSDRDHQGGLIELLKAGCDVDATTRKGDTALHLAAEDGSFETLQVLLEHGANPDLKNRRAQTALHLAARAHSPESVEVLLKSGSDPNAEDNDGRTPLHVALGRSTLTFDVFELLVEWKSNVNKADKYGYTPLHVAALNELSQCVDILIQRGADLSAKTKGGTTALSIILRKTPTSLNMFKQRLNNSIALRQHGSATGEVELRIDFHPLLQHRQQGEIGYLETFITEGYKEILEHPLCQSFLHLKWQKIRKYYVARLLFYLSYVLVLTAWVMTALAHVCVSDTHKQSGNENETVDTGSASNASCVYNATAVDKFLDDHPVIRKMEWYALIILTFIETFRKLMGITTYGTARQFFTQVDNVVEWCVVISVFSISCVNVKMTHAWQNHVGAYAILFAWGNLMLMIGQLPMFGAYVAMFTSIQAQVFKLLLAYACLLFGFTASFCVMFPTSKSFSNLHTGLIKVFVMMTGEVNFDELFLGNQDDQPPSGSTDTSWIFLQISAQLCFLSFLLFVTIVLMNLLVGIAVHDIKGLQKTAGLAKLVRQTKLICEVETALFLGFLPRRLIKMLRWSALVLPSSMRVVLTVRPLNPREKRLPPDVLAAAHKIARERRSVSIPENLCRKKSCSTTYTYLNSDAYSTLRRGVPIEDDEEDDGGYEKGGTPGDATAGNEVEQFKEEILELKKICNQNQKLIQDLVVALAMDGRHNPELAGDHNT